MSTNKKQLPAVRVKKHTQIAEELKCELYSDRRITLTKERAYKFLELDTFQGERAVNEHHVQFLFDQQQIGRFMWEQVAICTADYNSKTYRLNGQHTCWMRVNMDDKDEDPQVRELCYKVKTEEDLRGLYCTFDRNKSRSPAHSLKALMVGTPIMDGLWIGNLKHITGGLRLWLFGDSPDAKRMPPEDIHALITEKYTELFRASSFLHKELVEAFPALKREAVCAAIIATMNSNPDKSREFWAPIATGLGFTEKTDARYQLRNWLETHVRKDRSSASLVIVTSEDTYRVCVQAWNRWRKGQQVSILRAPEERPKVA